MKFNFEDLPVFNSSFNNHIEEHFQSTHFKNLTKTFFYKSSFIVPYHINKIQTIFYINQIGYS